MIRTLFAFIFLILFLVLSLPYLLVEALLGKRDPAASSYRQLRVVQWAFRVETFISGADVTLLGFDRIPKDRPVLYASNHLSMFDIIIIYGILPGRVGFIAKDSTQKLPILSIYMRRINCLFLNREDLRAGLQIILAACDLIKEGVSVFVFPEGTRNRSGDDTNLGPFHDGSFKITQKTGCPVIPVAVCNTSKLFEDHKPFIKKAPVVIEFGEPVLYKDLTIDERKQIGEHFRGIIFDMIKKNQELLKQP